jgi:hypothetical protein
MTSRRTFLRGLASTVALPVMPSLARSGAASGPAHPTRLAFIYFPNGVNLDSWRPKPAGSRWQPSPTLEPLTPLRDLVSVMRNLDHDKANANGDGGGDHARAGASFLTGCQPYKTAGADIRVGPSVDQIAARQLGHRTRVPSLELSTDPARSSGRCDSGYSCAYQYNLSWINPSTPAPAFRDPRLVFEKMFGSGNDKEDSRRRAYRKSILDFVHADAKRMHTRLASEDRAKMDEYLYAVREVEQQIEQAEEFKTKVPEHLRPIGIPDTYSGHIDVMFDMMVLAFQSDATRIATFMLAHDGSNRSFPEIGVPAGHHQISHHRDDPKKLAQIARIDRYYVEHFARFLQRLNKVREDDHTLLDRSMIVYGGGIADPNRHSHTDLPILLAGRGNGTLKSGRLIEARPGTPMTNLYLSLLDRFGAKVERIGDSTGRLEVL